MRRLAVSPCPAENATQKHRSPPSPFRQRQQPPFPCALGRRPALRLQPPAEVLHPHPVLDRGLLDTHLQLRQPLADLLYPDIPAQDGARGTPTQQVSDEEIGSPNPVTFPCLAYRQQNRPRFP